MRKVYLKYFSIEIVSVVKLEWSHVSIIKEIKHINHNDITAYYYPWNWITWLDPVGLKVKHDVDTKI